jgi:hypothetical protein
VDFVDIVLCNGRFVYFDCNLFCPATLNEAEIRTAMVNSIVFWSAAKERSSYE